MQAINTLVSNTREGLIKLIERDHRSRTAKVFLFPAGSGKWRGVAESSLMPNHRIDGVLYPNGSYEHIPLRKINGTIKTMKEDKWVTWKQ